MAVLAGYKANFYSSTGVSTATTDEATTDVGGLHTTFQVTNRAHMFLDPTVAVTVQTAPDGVTWGTVTSGFTIQYCGGIVTFTNAVSGATPACRLHAANYLVVSQSGNAKSVEVTPATDLVDITTFASAQANNGFKSKLALLGDATIKVSQWWIDGFYLSNLSNMFVVSAYSGANANQQIAAYAYLKTDGIKIDVKAPIEQSLEFESHGPLVYIAS